MTDSITLADGTLINTENGSRTINTEINRAFSDADNRKGKGRDEFVMGRRRYLDDLPMPYIQSKPVSIVIAYTLFGLSSGDISRILNIPTDHIDDLKQSNDYTMYMEGVLQNVREHDTNKIRKKLNAAAERASEKITDLISSRDEKVALTAAKDILDRTGNRPNDIVEHRHMHEGGITIRVIKDIKRDHEIELEADDAEPL